MQKIPYMITIGDKEEEAKTTAVRAHGKKGLTQIKPEDLIKEMKDKIDKRK